MDSTFAILAICGNSLIKDKNHIALSHHDKVLLEIGQYIADVTATGVNVVITHRNCFQVGFIYGRGELARHAVYLNFGEKNQGAIIRTTLPEIKRYLAEGHFRPGSGR